MHVPKHLIPYGTLVNPCPFFLWHVLLASWFTSYSTFRSSSTRLAVSPLLTSGELSLFSFRNSSPSSCALVPLDELLILEVFISSPGRSPPIQEPVGYGPAKSLTSAAMTHDIRHNNEIPNHASNVQNLAASFPLMPRIGFDCSLGSNPSSHFSQVC